MDVQVRHVYHALHSSAKGCGKVFLYFLLFFLAKRETWKEPKIVNSVNFHQLWGRLGRARDISHRMNGVYKI